jgi:hypothetical protein
MAANLGLALVAVTGLFVVFMAAVAYGAWMTRDIKLSGSTAAQ